VSPYRSRPSCLSRRVEPSMSENRNVTVPSGSVAMTVLHRNRTARRTEARTETLGDGLGSSPIAARSGGGHAASAPERKALTEMTALALPLDPAASGRGGAAAVLPARLVRPYG